MKKKPTVIGVFGQAVVEILNRPFLGVLRYCEEVGGFVVRDFRTLDVSSNNPGKVMQPQIWSGRCEGLVISTGRWHDMSDAQMADWVLQGGVPAVSTSGDWKDPRVVCVHVDQRALGLLAAKHLVECECRSFLFVGFADSSGSALRGLAFRETLAAQGHQVVEHALRCRLLGSGEDEELLLRESELIEHLRKLPRPLGVWALNDNFAAGVCLLCAKLGLEVPDQVKVLGTDDLSLARTNMPNLSSIHTPGERIGYLAMKALHRILDGKSVASKETAVAASELVARESTGRGRIAIGTLEAAVEYIARHACTGVSLEQLVKNTGLARSSFIEQFQQYVGRTPGKEIQRVRLERAKQLLRHEKVSVSRIASLVGFEETAAFSKFFTKQTGVSPRAFREKRD